MKKILTILLLCFASFAYSQVYTPVIANYTISGKPIGYSQATPSDGRSMFYDASNFIYRPYRDSQEVITYLNLPKYRAGNVIYFVDSGGTLNGNGTYTNLHVTYWTFQDGVANSNLIKLNWNGNSGGGSGCSTCFFTTTQLTDSSFKLNRPNGTSDTVVVDILNGTYLNTANNFLTATGTNVQAGGPLVQDTYANGGGHVFGITGNIFEQGQGATLTAANVMTTGSDGNSFPVIGSTQINAITTTNRQAGTIISFVFTGTPLLRNNQVAPAGSAPLLLAGGVDYTAATNDAITFLYDGSFWHEMSRKLAGSVIPVTANNAITLSGSLLQWGGTLVKPTTVAGNNFPTFFSGGRVEMPMGLPILAAGDLVPGNDGIFFHITGTTQINAISTTNFQAGAEIGFVFDNIVTVKNNTVGGVNTAPMLLAGRVDYTSAVGDYIGFRFDGVNFYETERKLAGSSSSVTANNGLTVTAGNVQLGGTLIQNTAIAQGSFRTIWTSSNPIGFEIDNTGSQAMRINYLNSGLGLSQGAGTGDGIDISNNIGYGINVQTFGQAGQFATTGIGVGGNPGSLAPNVYPFTTQYIPVTTSEQDSIQVFNKMSPSGGINTIGASMISAWGIADSAGLGTSSTSMIQKLRKTSAGAGNHTSSYGIALEYNGSYVNASSTPQWLLDGNGNVTTTGGKINHITTQAGGTYNIASNDWTVIATGTTSTWTFPALVAGQVWNLVNHGSGSITLSSPVTTANGTTSTTITAGSTYQVQYDGAMLRKIN